MDQYPLVWWSIEEKERPPLPSTTRIHDDGVKAKMLI